MRETLTIDIARPLTVDEVAIALRRSTRTIRRWIKKAGEMEMKNPLLAADIIRMPGSGVLIRPEALDRYLMIKKQAQTKALKISESIQEWKNEVAKATLLKRFGI